jgi:hypothetical protein
VFRFYQGAIKHGRGNALINDRATCDAQKDWRERAFFKKNQKIVATKKVKKQTRKRNYVSLIKI